MKNRFLPYRLPFSGSKRARRFAFVIFHHSKSTDRLDFHLQGQSVPYAAPPRLLLRRAGPRYSGCCPPPPSPSPRVASSLLHRLRRQCSRRRRSASPRPQVATREVGSSDRPQNDVPVISLPKPAAPPGSWLLLCAAARPRPSPVPSLSLERRAGRVQRSWCSFRGAVSGLLHGQQVNYGDAVASGALPWLCRSL